MFVYTELTLHHFSGGDFDVLDRVNPHAGFLNGVLACLQISGFIAPRRLYDRDSGYHTIQAFLEFCRDVLRAVCAAQFGARQCSRCAAGMCPILTQPEQGILCESKRDLLIGSTWLVRAASTDADLLTLTRDEKYFR